MHGLTDGQVLQRRRNQTAAAVVRGECAAAGAVFATINARGWKRKKVGRAAAGKFTATLAGVPVGGPYRITLTVGDESIVVRNIFVGDVWLLGGQSNMYGTGILNGKQPSHPKVRAMYMDDRWDIARDPIHFLPDSLDPVHNSTVFSRAARDKMRRAAVKGVGLGVYFGREMVKRTGAPQGLICTAHGGTSMAQWNPALKKLGGKSLYGSMLRRARKTGQPVAGVLWYQGESDANETAAPLYTQRMKKFIAALRRDLKQPRVPFLMVQLGRVFGEAWQMRSWNFIQRQQLELRKRVKNVDCVAAVDLPLDDTIHISAEAMPRLGARLARLADRLVNGNRRELPAPELAAISRKVSGRMKLTCPNRITLSFKNVVGGLRANGAPSGFTLVDGNYRDLNPFYKTTLAGNKVFLHTSLEDKQGAFKLMYGHGTTPHANITDERDMPIPVFGPVPVAVPDAAYTPYIIRWQVSRILPAERPVTKLPAPRPDNSLGLRVVEANEWSFVDMHLEWGGKNGQCIFFSDVSLSEPMKVDLLVGYDGPIKVWLDDREVFRDANGTNPAIPDAGVARLNLAQGTHRLAIAMDLNGGRAWGFFLRFRRRDVSRKQILGGDYAVPVGAS